jgi:aldehyde dehydrogenase (NAD+)
MVLKPTEKTPLSALVLADILYEAGLPPPMYQVVTGDPREIADEMLVNPDVDLVTFTGGVPVGKYIAAKAVYKRQVLELGGNDPIIVMDDADLEEAASLAAAGSYKNSGQRCTAVKRILVHERVADAFVDKLVARTRRVELRRPDGRHARDGHGHRRGRREELRGARERCGRARREAPRRQRAPRRRLRADGHRPRRPRDERRQDRDLRPGVAGDPLPRPRPRIAISNGTAYGLSSSVCTNRLDVITRLVRELNVGTVNVREVPGYRLELTRSAASRTRASATRKASRKR